MTDDLRALTVWQPHAWAIAQGLKDVENRPWPFPFQFGTTIAFHAGLKVDPEGLPVPVDVPDDLPSGVILCLVDVVGCVRDSRSRWARRAAFHWLLANARRLDEPVPTRGQMQLFRLPSDVVTRIHRQVDAPRASP